MVEWMPLVGGALAGTVFDLLIDFPLYKLGAFYAWVIRDREGRYVWGVGTGDVLGAAVGGGLFLAGEYFLKGALKNAGLGWLLALGCIKISELYHTLKAYYPIEPIELGKSVSAGFSTRRTKLERLTKT